MSDKIPRDVIIQRLNEDLVGPYMDNEELLSRPSDIYMTGILWPPKTEMVEEDDEGGSGESEEDDILSSTRIVGQYKPSSMGMSFAIDNKETTRIEICYGFGIYRHIPSTPDHEAKWQREQVKESLSIELSKNDRLEIPILKDRKDLDLAIYVRSVGFAEGIASTITIINRTASKSSDATIEDERTLFQVEIEIKCLDHTQFVGIEDKRPIVDEDSESARLLYSEEKSYAFGHHCSAQWNTTNGKVSSLKTSWIPTELVKSYKQTGHEVFSGLIKSDHLSTRYLALSSDDVVIAALKKLVNSYSDWISIQNKKLQEINENLKSVGNRHLNDCLQAQQRMENGIKFLESNKDAMAAFKLANLAMSMQHEWKDPDSKKSLAWRPFQIGFILVALESTCNKYSKERNFLDLLWFPTGGGKTEAYLALIAIGAIYLRLTEPTVANGNFAVMRYTLRLLTAQQFERASALILACEMLRKGNRPQELSHLNLGEKPFSIGLWVGKDATPNDFAGAMLARGSSDRESAEQVDKCFICKRPLRWIYSEKNRTVRPSCEEQTCELGPKFGIWPVLTVDDDLYNTRPTLVIGTVDKFAQLPRRLEMARLFGFGNEERTQLIVQDELHLISGPLGTIVGAYETAIDWLLTWRGSRPKVVGSTATIRRAEEQIRALFDRQSKQFPPSGISYGDSGFAVIDDEDPGRIYVGISTAGRSAKFTLQGIAGSLLQSGSSDLWKQQDLFDGYTTLLMYFNSLRELGGAKVQISDDVPKSIELYSAIRKEIAREIDAPRELTSFESQKEIIITLGDLSKSFKELGKVDVVQATNMVSVGVDVPRLGLMMVNGQPKTRSEYIQSTSRVGRSIYPGLIVCVLNSMKARDRSHFETFSSWHRTLYRDVEATSVTPFASRARDRVLRTLLVSMIRHSDAKMSQRPQLRNADEKNLLEVLTAIENRISRIDPSVLSESRKELELSLDIWMDREVSEYLDFTMAGSQNSLLQTAEMAAQKIASSINIGEAWPVMNTMRSVEAPTPFVLRERRAKKIAQNNGGGNVDVNQDPQISDSSNLPPWRRRG